MQKDVNPPTLFFERLPLILEKYILPLTEELEFVFCSKKSEVIDNCLRLNHITRSLPQSSSSAHRLLFRGLSYLRQHLYFLLHGSVGPKDIYAMVDYLGDIILSLQTLQVYKLHSCSVEKAITITKNFYEDYYSLCELCQIKVPKKILGTVLKDPLEKVYVVL